MIRDFEEYIHEGIVEKKSPDRSRADSLDKEAKQSEMTLQQISAHIGITDANANIIIKIAYDIAMARVRAHMLRAGYSAAGRGAHEAEVAYLRKLGYSHKDIEFCDRLRYYRNGIMYYGKSFDADYARKVMDFVERLMRQE